MIQACGADDRDAIVVPEKLSSPKTTFFINSVALLESITEQMGWSKALTYRVMGEKVSNSEMLVFPLNQAKIVREKKLED